MPSVQCPEVASPPHVSVRAVDTRHTDSKAVQKCVGGVQSMSRVPNQNGVSQA